MWMPQDVSVGSQVTEEIYIFCWERLEKDCQVRNQTGKCSVVKTISLVAIFFWGQKLLASLVNKKENPQINLYPA